MHGIGQEIHESPIHQHINNNNNNNKEANTSRDNNKYAHVVNARKEEEKKICFQHTTTLKRASDI